MASSKCTYYTDGKHVFNPMYVGGPEFCLCDAEAPTPPADSPSELDAILEAEHLPHNAPQLASFKAKLEAYIERHDRRRDEAHLAAILAKTNEIAGTYDSATATITAVEAAIRAELGGQS